MHKKATFPLLALALILGLSSCLGSKKLTQAELLVGKWEMITVEVDGESYNAADLGQSATFEFKKDGTAMFSTLEGIENGRYVFENGKITDPDAPSDTPVNVELLDETKLIIAIPDENMGAIRMSFTRIGEAGK